MSLLPFLAVAFGGGGLTLLIRRQERAATVVGLVSLVVAALAAGAIRAEGAVSIAGGSFGGTDFARLFLVLGCVTAIGLTLVSLATDHLHDLPAASLLALGAVAVALGSPDAALATFAVTGAGLAAFLVAIPDRREAPAVAAAARVLAVVGVAGIAAVTAAAWTARPIEAVVEDPTIIGLALFGLAGGLALRFGAIPFHGWAARLPDAAPELALPLLLAWTPAALALVALGWSNTMAAALAEPLALERTVVVAVGVVTLLLAVAAAVLHDDLEHVLVYAIVADGGIALLALGALDPDAWAPGRTWLLAFVVTKSALAGWVVAVRSTFGTRRLRDLRGWARRSPALALALVAIGVATLGWPGLAAFEARATLGDLSLGRPLGALATIGGLGAVGYLGRILLVGLGRRSATVAAGASSRPAWPLHTRRPPLRVIAREMPLVWGANRAPAAAALVLVLGLLAVAVAGGSFGSTAAAAAPPVQTAASVPPDVSPTPPAAPSRSPSAEPTPTPSPTPAVPSESVAASASPVTSTGAASASPTFVPVPVP